MRLNTSTSTLFVASSLFCFGSSLPFFRIHGEHAWFEPLVRRATYSVVPVDGGSASPTTTSPIASMIIETITATPAPETKTIIETDTIQSITTDFIISTIKGSETTKTVEITVLPPAGTTTVTKYSVINVSPPTATDVSASAKPTSSSSSSTTTIQPPEPSSSPVSINTSISSILSVIIAGSSLTSVMPSEPIASSQAPSATPSLSKSIDTSQSATYTSSFMASTGFSTITSVPATSTSTASYDDGKWHTTYPPWTNGTATVTMPSVTPRTISPIGIDAGDSLPSGLLTRAISFGSSMLQRIGM